MPIPLKSAQGLHNSRNMIINLNQIKGSQSTANTITKQQLLANTNHQGGAYSTIDYVQKPSSSAGQSAQKQQFSKKGSITRQNNNIQS
jgi:hypothetical protein